MYTGRLSDPMKASMASMKNSMRASIRDNRLSNNFERKYFEPQADVANTSGDKLLSNKDKSDAEK